MIADKTLYRGAGARVVDDDAYDDGPGDNGEAKAALSFMGEEDDTRSEEVPEYFGDGKLPEEEEFFDIERDDVLDTQNFEIVHPTSESDLIMMPMFTVSIDGLKEDPLRPHDLELLQGLPEELREAAIQLKQMLDPLEMDEPLPALSPSWFRITGNFVAIALNATLYRFIRYCRWEWRRLHDDLERLRVRDIPGYERTIMDDEPAEIESLAEQYVPLVLPSITNLHRLLVFNKFAHSYGWHCMLTRLERRAPGSRVIAYRVQLSKIADKIDQEPRLPHTAVSFTELMDIEMREASEPQTRPRSSTNGQATTDASTTKSLATSGLTRLNQQHQALPLLMYSIDGNPDVFMTASEIISFASSFGFTSLKKDQE
jgi:hypothetical protein